MEEEIGTALEPRELYTNNHIDAPMSHLLVGFTFVLGFLILGVSLMNRWRELALASEAKRAFDPSVPMQPGLHFVSGTVEFAQGEAIAVRVEIEQHGSEKKVKNGWVHSWKELNRTVTARPFYLRREDGTRVRVHPRTDVLLVDEVDQLRQPNRTTRFRSAELTAGEVAIVEGVLRRGDDPEAIAGEGGYRDASRGGWVMSSMLGTPLHISTEDLAQRHRLKAKRHGKAALVTSAMIMLAALPTASYFLRAFAAEPALASAEGRRHFTTRGNRGSTVHHYAVDLSVSPANGESESMVVELDEDDWLTVRPGEQLRFQYFADNELISAPGAGSSIHYALWLLALGCILGGAFSVLSAMRWRRWYEGSLDEAGKGKLPDFPQVPGFP